MYHKYKTEALGFYVGLTEMKIPPIPFNPDGIGNNLFFFFNPSCKIISTTAGSINNSRICLRKRRHTIQHEKKQDNDAHIVELK
jgi:hypothetical protein